MIDLTPLEVRKKKGDFRRGIRGYDQPQVDEFLDVVADRLDELVRESMALKEQVGTLEQQVTDFRAREKALTEALVSAQELRQDMKTQVAREADLARRQAEQEVETIRARAEQLREQEEATLQRLRGRQLQIVQTYREFLQRELSDLNSIEEAIDLNDGLDELPVERRRPRRPAPRASKKAAAREDSKEASSDESEEGSDDSPWDEATNNGQQVAEPAKPVASRGATKTPSRRKGAPTPEASDAPAASAEPDTDDDPSAWIDELLSQPELKPVRPPPLAAPIDVEPEPMPDSELTLSDDDVVDRARDGRAVAEAAEDALDDLWDDTIVDEGSGARTASERAAADSTLDAVTDAEDLLDTIDELIADASADSQATEVSADVADEADVEEELPDLLDAEVEPDVEVGAQALATEFEALAQDVDADATAVGAETEANEDIAAELAEADESAAQEPATELVESKASSAGGNRVSTATENEPATAEAEDAEPESLADEPVERAETDDAGVSAEAGAGEPDPAASPFREDDDRNDPNLGLSLVAERGSFQDFGDFSDLQGSADFGLLPEFDADGMTNDVAGLTLRDKGGDGTSTADTGEDDLSDDDPEDLLSTVFGDGR